MTSDLIDRLRDASVFYDVPSLRHEAAKEIEELREKLSRTPIDWDVECDALQRSNDALRAEVEQWKGRALTADEIAAGFRAGVKQADDAFAVCQMSNKELRAEVEWLKSQRAGFIDRNTDLRVEVERLREANIRFSDQCAIHDARVVELENAVRIAQGITDAAIEDYNDALAAWDRAEARAEKSSSNRHTSGKDGGG